MFAYVIHVYGNQVFCVWARERTSPTRPPFRVIRCRCDFPRRAASSRALWFLNNVPSELQLFSEIAGIEPLARPYSSKDAGPSHERQRRRIVLYQRQGPFPHDPQEPLMT